MEQLQYLGNIQCGRNDLGLKECSICLGRKKWRTFKWEEEEEVHKCGGENANR